MATTDLTLASNITDAQQTAINVLNAAFTNLKQDGTAKSDAPRLFFPNGIELISITVKLTPVEVTLEIAGAAGIKHPLDGSPHPAPETPQLPA